MSIIETAFTPAMEQTGQDGQDTVLYLEPYLGHIDKWDCLQNLLRSLNVPDMFPKTAIPSMPSSVDRIALRGDVLAVSWKKGDDEDIAVHYGIYIGLNKDGVGEVVDMVHEGSVTRRLVDDFMGLRNPHGRVIRKLGVVKYDGDTPERLESSAKIAEIVASMTPAHKPVYNLILCNCEVFALWCRTPWRFVPFLIDVPILPPMISKKF